MANLTFKKAERLTSLKQIESLVKNGRSCSAFPLKLIWMKFTIEEKVPAKLAITVPKKLVPLAVNRNKIKRRIREVYRKAKPDFYDQLAKKEQQFILLIIYRSKEICSYSELEKKWSVVMNKFLNEAN